MTMSERFETTVVGAEYADAYEWTKATPPSAWRPVTPGDEIIGIYIGKTVMTGVNGQYDVVLIDVPRTGRFMVSGVQVVRSVDAARFDEGEPIRVVYGGKKDIGGERFMKVLDVYRGSSHPCVDGIPALQ